ncbi:hypothetical protein AX16_000012 [Volvariella volvacea WC 439]|nr:hypothetical protein AX16_000012 [Volvariella volvacea WC 439]
MAKNKLQWGFIHSLEYIRILRLEYAKNRPYVTISDEIPTNSPPPQSIFSLICYMLLTSRESPPIFQTIKAQICDPPVKKVEAPHPPMVPSLDTVSPPPMHISKVVLHTTAGEGDIIGISMMRLDELPVSPAEAREMHLYDLSFIGAGTYGKVFRCNAYAEGNCCGTMVVKFAAAQREDQLGEEARVYGSLRRLYDAVIPRYYGYFAGVSGGLVYSVLLLSDYGHGLGDHAELKNLPLEERVELLKFALEIHRAGIVHKDFCPPTSYDRSTVYGSWTFQLH